MSEEMSVRRMRFLRWLDAALGRVGLVTVKFHANVVSQWKALSRIEEGMARQAVRDRDEAVASEGRAMSRLNDLKCATGVHQKFGGSIDVDFDKLIKALGPAQSRKLRVCIDDHLKRSKRKPRSRR